MKCSKTIKDQLILAQMRRRSMMKKRNCSITTLKPFMQEQHLPRKHQMGALKIKMSLKYMDLV